MSYSFGLVGRINRYTRNTYIDIVVQLDTPGAIQFHLFECLTDNIVGLVLRVLGRLDHCTFIQVALVIHVKLAKGILKLEDLLLLELRVLPATSQCRSTEGYACSAYL